MSRLVFHFRSAVPLRFVTLWLLLGLPFLKIGAADAKTNGRFIATAYSVTGITASGEYTHRHVVAADPDILPIGSRIKIKWAGRYSGEYVVADTGEKIVGRRLDLYMPNATECKKFGRRQVRVKLIQLGAGTHADAKQADKAVKQDVAKDVSKGAVGNAATELDWATQGGKAKAAALAGTPGSTAATSAASPNPAPKPTTPAQTTPAPQQ
ncbi:MAG TPA: 3D domain-containing protein [Bryobacteraceae bacterium]|nr:3D domain-containing protein [Bryobacteraceae bacterium]